MAPTYACIPRVGAPEKLEEGRSTGTGVISGLSGVAVRRLLCQRENLKESGGATDGQDGQQRLKQFRDRRVWNSPQNSISHNLSKFSIASAIRSRVWPGGRRARRCRPASGTGR